MFRHRGLTLLPDGKCECQFVRYPCDSPSNLLDGALRAAPHFGSPEALGDAAFGLLGGAR
jgi:hypothetical protein